nr:hypothetical protein CFP56_24105 [Quercus suber]
MVSVLFLIEKLMSQGCSTKENEMSTHSQGMVRGYVRFARIERTKDLANSPLRHHQHLGGWTLAHFIAQRYSILLCRIDPSHSQLWESVAVVQPRSLRDRQSP